MDSSKDEALSPLPSNIELVTEYDALVIRRSWKTGASYFLVFFTVLWNAFMVVWMGIALSQGQWTMAAFGSLHASVGIGLIYFTVASFLNKTDIRINGYTLTVSHAPLPWFGKLEVPVESIKQVYCKKRVRRSKNGTHVSYSVQYLDQAGREKKLLTGLNDNDQALYIETEIERTLGIKDRTVTGESK